MIVLIFWLTFICTWLRLLATAIADPASGHLGATRDSTRLAVALGQALLQASLIYGVTIVALTEGLSLFQVLKWQWVHGFWLSVLLGYGVFYHQRRDQWIGDRKTLQQLLARSSLLLRHPSLMAIGLILGITLTTALLSAPNTWDGMTYHMPRVMQWLQNHTVSHYPTHELRQIALAPGAGYLVAHFQLLAGSDCLAALPQWWAFLGCTIGSFILGTHWGNGQVGILAALVCCSLPMAIMQSTTVQNDLLVAFWLLCFLNFTLTKDALPTLAQCLWAAAALALALVTKATTLIFCPSLFLMLGIRWQVWRRGWRWRLTTAVVLGSMLLPSLPSFWRNWQTFGQPLGLDFNTRNTVIGIRPLISNLLKNLALNVPIPGIWPLLQRLHPPLLGLSLDDLRLNFTTPPVLDGKTSSLEAVLKVLAPHNGFVGSPVHLILLTMASWGFFAILGRSKKMRSPDQPLPLALIYLAVANLVSFLLFCGLLKWQPWGNRLWLPLLVCNAPVIAWSLAHHWSMQKRALVVLALSLMGIVYALTPMNHPLIGLPVPSAEQSDSILTLPRSDLYFSGARKELKLPYQLAVSQIARHNCRAIGLALIGEDWEYPFWVLLQQTLGPTFQVRAVGMQNPSMHLPAPLTESQLCGVITTRLGDYRPPAAQQWQQVSIAIEPPMALWLK